MKGPWQLYCDIDPIGGIEIPMLRAQSICVYMADLLRKEAVSQKWIQACKMYNLDPIPKGPRGSDHVLLHLDLELRRN